MFGVECKETSLLRIASELVARACLRAYKIVVDSMLVGCYGLRSDRGLRSNQGYVCGDVLYQLF